MFLTLLILTSCKKEISKDDLLVKSANVSSKQSTKISKKDYELLKSNPDNIKLFDSLMKANKLKVNKLASTSSVANADDDSGLYEDGDDDVYYLFDNPGYLYFASEAMGVRYDVTADFAFVKRRNTLITKIPLTYSMKMSDLNPMVSGPVVAYLIGPAVGEIERPAQPYANVSQPSFGRLKGNAAGDILEKRTIIRTTDGKTLVKGGLKADTYEAGTEISLGISVEWARNSVSLYRFDLNFDIDFDQDMNGANPRTRLNGTAVCQGLQAN
ncbi:hypothetical protein [Pedobacter sp. R20-19]|uniref:hypothetical protein n=1 Tax=Pedobacter sp. R20-19 TaxID=1270196 RepID=UPI00049303ED|nr:hypothetical protein [Pedobacter sp. R20-19]